jgi:D-tyrosyl-tRNA(Tyr) deacylase
VVGAIDRGLLVLLGIERGDGPSDRDYIVSKTLELRIFPDADGRMNMSVSDSGGSLLIVSQFTLCGDARKGPPSMTRRRRRKRGCSTRTSCVSCGRPTCQWRRGSFRP